MFVYFPKNYVWSMSTVIAATHGGSIGEIDDICRPLLEKSTEDADVGTLDFLHAWVKGADKLVTLAEKDLEKKRTLSAGEKFQRAGLYYLIAERMQEQGSPERLKAYTRYLEIFEQSRIYKNEGVSRVEIPYHDTHLSAIYAKAKSQNEKQAIVVMMNGLDSTKELMFCNPMVQDLINRGISVLLLDQPGTGEAIRLQQLPAVYNSEIWASKVVDWLYEQPEIDQKRIAAFGVSLGGYYCPRAVAFEPRFCCGAIWGANHDWRTVQQSRLKREGENPVPHYWKHVEWVFGAKDSETFFEIAENMHLNGVLDRIKVPFLVTHGAHDRQIPLKYAYETYEQLVNSPNKELLIIDDAMGGVEHSSVDNPLNSGAYIADWFAEQLGGNTGNK
ncbi:prolyl oligopeptidase family serine peptidase [Acinetobacter gerneri]|uniref:Prolyl oligopeptidase family serine peptidase n=1 Tax=Acinetobacter gerneri TaxID=202952 RepID=A0AAW8JLH1_9GAMM|nr:prolyl oligopeptidase family serine peptidase [Acinetobacter gerneri]MDQ9011608.1 prolyl oligopeptidase family serine peptidase [Acinetobacter gerneri]MDQ9015742.1 prolyl oligopeptidase family serine peptidase [Acinetobacter gerneri]MDQ9026913.1 prolyl oligopeptidase family serine peptidase [Acinetobacter gerneri]MDQ9054196.1 prolyl oligopeptidase family serine peptidase [Acinetobacter gerneri]MDQ9061867.1 prolyl oligopeptidase family serine peptidase [Acinetobacter gerneri]